MPVPSPIRERLHDFIGLSEEIRYVFPASSVGGGAHFFFVITESAISVVTTGALSRTRPRSVWGTYPRRTRIGPVETGAGAFFEFATVHFEVDDEYIAVINAADAEIFDQDLLPEDPLPDL
jgi:hypothetical protein